MSLVTIISELVRFIKDYFFKIIIGALIIAVCTIGIRYYRANFENKEIEVAYNSLLKRYEQEPAEFQFVVTKPDGSLFNNSFIFDEYLSQPQIVSEIEKMTGVEFHQWLEEEIALELVKNATFRGGLASLRNTSADVMTLRVLVGRTAEENLKIAQAYQNLLENNALPFLAGNQLTILNDAAIGERLSSEQFLNLATADTLSSLSNLSPRSMIIFGVAGFIGGFILVAMILFVLRLFKKVIAYAFDYAWDMNDAHLIYYRNRVQSAQLLQELLTIPKLTSRYIVIQGDPSKLLPVDEQINAIYVTSIKDVQTDVQEIILVIYTNQTTKDWFNHQYQLAKLYKVPVKIIQIS